MPKNEAMKANRKWYIIDATNVVLGDLAVVAANILRGKNKPIFANNTDCGDYLIIVNAKKVKLTGKKLIDKKYHSTSMYMSGIRTRSAQEMIDKYPTELVEIAIKGMIPKTRLGRQIFKKLHVYEGETKNLEAQNPEKVEVK